MRLLLAALLGGLVLFFWGFVLNMLLPVGEMGHRFPASEDAVLTVLAANMSEEGVYIVPGLTREQYADPSIAEAYAAKSAASPYAFVIYQPSGENGLEMVDELAIQLGTAVLGSWVLAWVLSLAPWSFGRRVAVSTGLGLFAWLAVGLPWWNWYRFPTEFILGSLVQQMSGWFLAGIAIAWVLGRKVRRSY